MRVENAFPAIVTSENILTERNIRELVEVLDEEMDSVAYEERQRLETIEEELAEGAVPAGPSSTTPSSRRKTARCAVVT